MRNSYTSARTPITGREISWIIQEKIEAPPPDPVVPTITKEDKVFVEQTQEEITKALRGDTP